MVTIKPLSRISPSTFTALKKCNLKVLLSNCIDIPLLPYTPNNHLGTVIHKIIEGIIKGEIQSHEEFYSKWDSVIAEEEEVMINAGLEQFIPISRNVSSYTIRKLLTRALIDRRKEQSASNLPGYFITEKWLSSNDNKIGGKIDLIYTNGDYTRLTDFKSGKVIEDNGELKVEYETQLKLYAYLYSENKGIYPTELSVVDIQQNHYEIEFKKEECMALALQAKSLLNEINMKIEEGNLDELSSVGIEHCRFCLNRPACKDYKEHLKSEDQSVTFIDITGELQDYRLFDNHSLNVHINAKGLRKSVSHIDESYEGFFSTRIGKEITIYNVLATKRENKCKGLITTRIYG